MIRIKRNLIIILINIVIKARSVIESPKIRKLKKRKRSLKSIINNPKDLIPLKIQLYRKRKMILNLLGLSCLPITLSTSKRKMMMRKKRKENGEIY